MYEKLTLPNGVRIVFEKMPYVRTACVGIWIGIGSRDEARADNGSAHFIEHMLFKGTKSATAAQLASIMDGIGGQINAFTTRESTCFYARVLDSHLNTAIDTLGDMFFNSLFDEEDVKNERGVILEEIDMYDDSPEDMVTERLLARCFRGALGRPVLGTPSTLGRMTGASLSGFMRDNYQPERIVVALSGCFDDGHIKRIEGLFSALSAVKAKKRRAADYTPVVALKKKTTEQNHLCLGFPGLALGTDDRFAMNLLTSIIGGGMSSRLFQSVREKHGLCYSIYAFGAGFTDTGFFGVETALGSDTEEKALGIIMSELSDVRDSGVTQEELDRAREQAKSSFVMALESTSSRMNRLGNGELFLGGATDPDELLERYDAVNREMVHELAARVLDYEKMSFSAVGRLRPEEFYRSILKI